jgi:hypothetical protein
MVDTVSIEASSCCASEKTERIESGRGPEDHVHHSVLDKLCTKVVVEMNRKKSSPSRATGPSLSCNEDNIVLFFASITAVCLSSRQSFLSTAASQTGVVC